MRRRFIYLTIIFLVIGALLSLQTLWAVSLKEQLDKSSRMKLWILANRYAPRRGIVAKIGDKDQLIYEPKRPDEGFAQPVVSPRGRKLAFVKTTGEGIQNSVNLKLGIIDIDGSNYLELLNLTALSPSDMALSPDETRLAFMGALRKGSYSLAILDLASRPPVVLYERSLPQGKSSINMTSQAWAPDSRRLVFVNADEHMVILDIATKKETDIGTGDDPTWSRDGRYIAYRADSIGNPPGDYLLVSVAQPSAERKSILANKDSQRSNWYLGPLLWSPNDRFLLVARIVGPNERQQPHVIDVRTGHIEALPIGSMGDMRSWGGRS